jgi:hypothetical protein
MEMKLGFYFCGVFSFCVLIYQMHRTIVESTSGSESLFWGTSSIRTLSVIVAWTWVPFPIWYALSPEGFNIVQNSAAMKIAVAFLNVFSKGAFIYYLMRVRADLEVREMVLAEVDAVNEPDKFVLNGFTNDVKPEGQKMSAKLSAVIFEVLQAMGRQGNLESMKEVLMQHMITTPEDLMVLTPEYCDSISLPYGFVTACKAKIRQRKVESHEKWNLDPEKKLDNFDNVSVATAPLPPQVANDPRKLKEHHRRAAEGYGRGNSKPLQKDNEHWNDCLSGETARNHLGTQDEPCTPQNYRELSGMSTDEVQAIIAASQNALVHELREMKRSQMEERSRLKRLEDKMENDLDQIQGSMGGMITQVMDSIESRLRSPERVSDRRKLVEGTTTNKGDDSV